VAVGLSPGRSKSGSGGRTGAIQDNAARPKMAPRRAKKTSGHPPKALDEGLRPSMLFGMPSLCLSCQTDVLHAERPSLYDNRAQPNASDREAQRKVGGPRLGASFRLATEKQTARAREIAKWLKFRRSWVTGALRTLAGKGLVNYAPYELVALTREGAADGESDPLRERHTPLQAFCVMLLCLVSAPCIATIAVTGRESSSCQRALLELGGLRVLAFVVTTIVYPVGRLFSAGTS
jgi:hypothetical protein